MDFESPEFEISLTPKETVQISRDPDAFEYRPLFTIILLSDGNSIPVWVDHCGCLPSESSSAFRGDASNHSD